MNITPEQMKAIRKLRDIATNVYEYEHPEKHLRNNFYFEKLLDAIVNLDNLLLEPELPNKHKPNKS